MKRLQLGPGSFPGWLLLALGGAALSAPASAQQPGEDAAIQEYRKLIQRKPFFYHTRARMALARSRESKPLDLLLQDYVKPHEHPEWARYTIGTMVRLYFDNWTWADKFEAVRRQRSGPGDMWLWVNTLALDDRDGGGASVVKMIRETKDILHKAAGIAALGRKARPEVLAVIPEVVAAFPKKRKAGERRLLVGALSTAILAHKGAIKEPAMQTAIRAYIGLLGKKVELDKSAKMVIARHLAKTIGKDRLYIEPEPWIQLLDQGYEPPKRSGTTVTQLRFFGIEAEGDRICYLVDMSNSMLKPIDPKLIPKGPITGPKKKKKRRGQLPDENDIPWHRIKTRFDLAREHLRISLQRLSKDKKFCVVWFGDKSGLLRGTPGMVKASRGNVKKVLKELDGMKPDMSVPPGKSKQDFPNGRLKGETNMHSGFRHAFALRAKSFAPEHEYVDIKAMAQGCDTIFLLSDGAPTVDDFIVADQDYGEGRVVYDRESKREAPRPQTIVYHGPMDQKGWILDEVRRMNTFRKVQIHCIGFGEADKELLKGLAKIGAGETYFLGSK